MLEKLSLLWLLVAGIMNGSFVIPMRFAKDLNAKHIWFFHSIIGLIIVPWLILGIWFSHTASYYKFLASDLLYLLAITGVAFGIGQVCFFYAIEKLGVALAFVINLSIGVTLGSLFVVFYKHLFLSDLNFIL